MCHEPISRDHSHMQLQQQLIRLITQCIPISMSRPHSSLSVWLNHWLSTLYLMRYWSSTQKIPLYLDIYCIVSKVLWHYMCIPGDNFHFCVDFRNLKRPAFVHPLIVWPLIYLRCVLFHGNTVEVPWWFLVTARVRFRSKTFWWHIQLACNHCCNFDSGWPFGRSDSVSFSNQLTTLYLLEKTLTEGCRNDTCFCWIALVSGAKIISMVSFTGISNKTLSLFSK